MIKQLDQSLTDTEAEKLRAGILKTAKAIKPRETINDLLSDPDAQSKGLTEDCSKYWLAPFEPNRKQSKLKGLTNIQAFVFLTCLTHALGELEATGPYHEPFEEMPPRWQTQQLLRAAHKIRTNEREVLEWCKARIDRTEPFDEYEGFVEMLRQDNSTDKTTILMKSVLLEIADRAVLKAPSHTKKPEAIRSRHAQEIASNAASGLTPVVDSQNATLALAPMFLPSVRALFEQPLLKALAARKLS